MIVVVVLLVLALLLGSAGLFVTGLKWALLVALILAVAGAVTGYRSRP